MSPIQPAIVAWHFGHLSPWEQALVYALGVGPFLVLAVVVFVVRRNDAEDRQDPR